MNIIYGKSCTGKTRKLIELSSETGAIIVTSSGFRARRLKDKAEAYGIPIPDPISCEEAVMNNSSKDTVYLVDDVDEVLESLFGRKVDTATLTDEDGVLETSNCDE